MNTIELLKANWRAGLRMPYPADAAALEDIKALECVTVINGIFVLAGVGLWEQGELLYLTARRAGGMVWLQLQTNSEL